MLIDPKLAGYTFEKMYIYIPRLALLQSFLKLSVGQAQLLFESSYMRLGGHGNSFAFPSTQFTNLSQISVSQ